MSMRHRFFRAFAGFAVLAALALPGLQPAASQKRAAAFLTNGQELRISVPQFVVTAIRFKSNDETGWYWTGSDEVYAVFSDMDPTHGDRVTSVYGNVDEGDTVNFRSADQCVAPQPNCDRGMSSLNVRFSFWERDWGGFAYGDFAGGHYRLQNGSHSFDDLIGHGSIILSQEELVAALPVGASRDYTVSPTGGAGKYRFTYRISRLANIDRSIVIHLPPILPVSITLDAVVSMINGEQFVRLTWSGAATATVDIYRDGAKLVTVPNNGSYRDQAPSGAHQYRVCNLGSTTECSAQVTVTVP